MITGDLLIDWKSVSSVVVVVASVFHLILSLATCSHSPFVSETSEPLTESDGAQSPIITDRSKVILRKEEYSYLKGNIGYRFTNWTESVVYVPVCHDPFPPVLQKFEDNEWILGYSRYVPLCLGKPLEIGPGESIALTYTIIHGLQGSNMVNMFRVSEIEGRYRMVWNVYQSKDNYNRTFDLLPLKLRISNSFTIEVGPEA